MTSRKRSPKRKSSLARKLEAVRGKAAAGRRNFRITPETHVTDPEFHVLSHTAVRDALTAVKVRTEKLDPKALFLQEQGDPAAFEKTLLEVRKMLGPQAQILADKLIWPEYDFGVRLRAAEMSIDRVNPMPHRIDSGRKTKYSILRVDPNKKELVLEEKAGTPPKSAGDEPI